MNWSVVVDDLLTGLRETLTALLVTLFVLKVAHLIALSWVWVLAPLWVPVALFVLAMFALVSRNAYLRGVR